VAIKGLDPGEEFAVVAARDQDLRVGARGGLKQRERSSSELMFFDKRDFIFTVMKFLLMSLLEVGCGGR